MEGMELENRRQHPKHIIDLEYIQPPCQLLHHYFFGNPDINFLLGLIISDRATPPDIACFTTREPRQHFCLGRTSYTYII